MQLSKNQILFILIGIATITTGAFAHFFLPEKYYYDAVLIATDPYNQKGIINSYPVAMLFYDTLFLNKLPYSIVSIIQLTIIFYFFYKLSVPKNFTKLYLSNILIWSALIALSIYISMPSKEFINILFIFFIAFIFKSKRYKPKIKIYIILVLFGLFGLWYRIYFIMLPILAVVSFLVFRLKISKKIITSIFVSVLAAIFMSISYAVVSGEYISESTREELNEKRKGRQDSQTLIVSPIRTNNPIGEAVGIIYGYITVNLPFESIIKFYYKPQVILFSIWQILLFYVLIIKFNKAREVSKSPFDERLWLFHVVFSYFVIQGVFEPDLGSSIRHKFGVLPIIYQAIFYKRLYDK
tara:strand:+ start:96 stop:1154 length:1059 start_codon:yes stop_codon:yes gene_type:complete